MRTSLLVTVSLPPAIVRASMRVAKRHHMTRSEIMRAALRQYLEEQSALEAITTYQAEARTGKLKKLKSLSKIKNAQTYGKT